MRAFGQKLVKFCTLTHTLTHAAKFVVRIIIIYLPIAPIQVQLKVSIGGTLENTLGSVCSDI